MCERGSKERERQRQIEAETIQLTEKVKIDRMREGVRKLKGCLLGIISNEPVQIDTSSFYQTRLTTPNHTDMHHILECSQRSVKPNKLVFVSIVASGIHCHSPQTKSCVLGLSV